MRNDFLTKIDLDLMAVAGCSNPNCNHDHDGTTYLHSTCHQNTPTWARYEAGSGVLELICAKCKRRVAAIKVGLISDK